MANVRHSRVNSQPTAPRTRWLAFTLFSIGPLLLFLSGCNGGHPMVKEMESTYARNENNEDVDIVVQKYFPVGMELEDALKTFQVLKAQGFSVYESRLHGGADWPDGEMRPYPEETIKFKHKYFSRTGASVIYTASKRLEKKLIIFEKHAVIRVYGAGGKVILSEGLINYQTLVP